MALRVHRVVLALAGALVVLLALAAGARAAALPLTAPLPKTPPRFRVGAARALALASATGQVRHARADGGRLTAAVDRADDWTWAVHVRRDGRDVLEVDVDGRVPRVVGTAPYLEYGHVGGRADAPWLWAVLCLAFAAPFFDPRRPFRLLHLDLAVLLSFGLSHLLLTRGDLALSVPLVYPPLLYLAARLLLAGRRGTATGSGSTAPAVPYAPTRLLLAGTGALLGLHVAIALTVRRVMDVGFFSVVGADRILTGLPLYEPSQVHGNTYGALNYIAYTPFVHLWPYVEGDLRPFAATAAAITWDLLVAALLFALGRRMRDVRLGATLAYAWAAFPYALYATALGTNDALVPALVLGALLLTGVPLGRGALLGLAAATKFSPAALLPLIARGPRFSPAAAAATALACAATFAFPFLGHVPAAGIHGIWTQTLGFQLHRASSFSPWGQHPGLGWLKAAAQLTALAIVAATALLPGPRDLPRIAALAGAALVAVQLPAIQWFYFYVVWFAPLALAGLLAQADQRSGEPQSVSSRSTALSTLPLGLRGSGS